MFLLIVTGLSGAGKSQAVRRLEDTGFFCVDNLPSELLPNFISLCMKAEPEVERAAVVVDSRSAVFRSDLENAMRMLDELHVEHRMLFLDCRSDILERRYNETRRRHPLNDDIKAGIAKERSMLTPLRESADYLIDTSDLKPLEMSRKLDEFVLGHQGDGFILTLESFGYKRGVPLEADMVFDMRFSENPFYVPELRQLSGMDAPVRDFVMADKDFVYALDQAEEILRRLVQRIHEILVRHHKIPHRSVHAAQLAKLWHIEGVFRKAGSGYSAEGDAGHVCRLAWDRFRR